MSLHLIGGGWDPAATSALYGPFLEQAGGSPTIACVVLDEGDGLEQFERWATVLRRTTACEPVPVLVPLGGSFEVAALGDADGLLVCGGLTPAYADALSPVGPQLRQWLGDKPYAGFSAGAAIAPRRGVVGGWLHGDVPVCSDDAAEDLDAVTVVDGLGLLDAAVEVHCAQWGTLPRLLAAMELADLPTGIALDENTALHVTAEGAEVAGIGAARRVVWHDGSATVTRHLAGDRFAVART